MSIATAPDGTETHIRAIVFREGDVFVAQCLEYDIAAQHKDLVSLAERLELTVDAEIAWCEERGKAPTECIAPAPKYYFDLWEMRSMTLERVSVALPISHHKIEMALAQAA